MQMHQESMKELTLRGIILGALITIIFTASNIYLGLKVGLTFSTSIPAAVISMAALSLFANSSILENNMVQTQASAAGTLSSVVFILPALLIVGYWTSFPFWQTMFICTAGGFLGVVFTIPLRRTMVVNSPLPYPEGVAAAEILKVGHSENEAEKGGAKEIVVGSAIAAVVTFFAAGARLIADSSSFWLVKSKAVFQFPISFSMALVSAGYLMGVYAGGAMIVGVILGWGILVPALSMPEMSMAMDKAAMIETANMVWVRDVRLVGAGAIAIAAVWTLVTLLKPMLHGIKLSIESIRDHDRGVNVERTDQDMSAKSLMAVVFISVLLLGLVFHSFVQDAPVSAALGWGLVLFAVAIAFLIGFFVAAACGYMAGLIGSSNSPISGIGIISIIVVSTLLFFLSASFEETLGSEEGRRFAMALAIFITSAVVAVACIANDNLQDLKTGFLVKATPKAQQIALLIGCVVGALVIAPVIDVLYNAYGLAGAPLPETLSKLDQVDTTTMLSAPQATLMATIARGVFSENLNWSMIFLGLLIGAGIIIIDTILGKMKARIRIPALAIGMGIYLPPSIPVAIFIGSMMRLLIELRIRKKAPDNQKEKTLQNSERKGTLLASGLIVGESLMGVFVAIAILVSMSTGGSGGPFALDSFFYGAFSDVMTADMKKYLGLFVFAAICFFFYKRVGKIVR